MHYIDNCLEECNVSVVTASLTQCAGNWQELNYVPSYNKFYYIVKGEGELTVARASLSPHGRSALSHARRRFAILSHDGWPSLLQILVSLSGKGGEPESLRSDPDAPLRYGL